MAKAKKTVSPKHSRVIVYRSARTGRFVTKSYAVKNPATTIKQKVKIAGTDHTGPRSK